MSTGTNEFNKAYKVAKKSGFIFDIGEYVFVYGPGFDPTVLYEITGGINTNYYLFANSPNPMKYIYYNQIERPSRKETKMANKPQHNIEDSFIICLYENGQLHPKSTPKLYSEQTALIAAEKLAKRTGKDFIILKTFGSVKQPKNIVPKFRKF